MGSQCTAHGFLHVSSWQLSEKELPTIYVTHYNISTWAAHGQLSGQELPPNFQSLYNICPLAAQTVR